MKKQLLILSFLGCGFAFGQNASRGAINFTSLSPSSPVAFQFDTGYIGQLQSGSSFSTLLPTDRWFSIGQVSASSQIFYGQRFQYDGRALVTGYTSASPSNPRIEWIHSGGSTAGNLEFRVANNFTNGISTIVSSMTPDGNTYFARFPSSFGSLNPKVGIIFKEQPGLLMFPEATVTSSNPVGISLSLPHATNSANGIQSSVIGGESSTAISGKAEGATSSIGVYGTTTNNTAFGAAVYGDLMATGPNLWSGYFNGDVFIMGTYGPSDAKLKNNITKENSALEKILLLNPVSYKYNEVKGMNLPQTLQHGFISQEIAEVFPELTKDMNQPIFDENGGVKSEVSFKALNYVGLISVLTAAVQELNTELTQVRQDLEEYKANDAVRSQIIQNSSSVNGYSIEQNVPNPFSDRTSIRFQLAPGVETATLSIFNLNGAFVRDYQLNGNAGDVEILASEIGKGMYIYSLNQNGQEIISKRMIVK